MKPTNLQHRTAGARPAGLVLALGGALLLASATAAAVAVGGPGGTAEQGRRQVVAAPVAGAVAPTLELVSGRIDAVDATAGTVTVRGAVLPLHPSALRVLSPGGQALGGVRALQRGQTVRFALEPEAAGAGQAASAVAPTARRVVLVYVDAAP